MNIEKIKNTFENFYLNGQIIEKLEINFNKKTADFFKSYSLEKRKTFSSVVKLKINGKEMLLSDPYLNINPDLKTFTKIISNVIGVARKLNIEAPKVAILSAVEVVNLNMESSLYGCVAEAMGKRKQFGKDIFVEGPLSMDVAISMEAARGKNVVTDVAGKANILISHRNSIVKGILEALTLFANAKTETYLTDGENIFKL